MKTVILSLEVAFILVEVARWHIPIKRLLRLPADKRLKPLDCFPCLSMWVCVALVFTPAQIIDKAFLIATTAVFGQIIGKTLTEWKLK